MRLTKIARRQAAEMTKKVLEFKSTFENVIQGDLPPFWDGNNDLIPLEVYKEKLSAIREDCANINALAPAIKGATIYNVLYNDYRVCFDLKKFFDELGTPSFDDISDIEMMIRSTRDHKYPLNKEWGEMMV